MKKPDGTNRGCTRRVFINRGLAATGGAMFMSQAHAWPAWAAEGVSGAIERMGRVAYDPESGRTCVAKVVVDVTTREIDTPYGRTKASEAKDAIMVRSRGKGPYTGWKDVTRDMPHAKLDPRMCARGGKAAIVWAAMDHETREWRVFASVSEDGGEWSAPMEAAGGERPALHPDVAVDPDKGHLWIVYEDWADGSIQLITWDGYYWGGPIVISEQGKNYRPRVIITRKNGKNKGALAIAWDSYRDGQYDIYLRTVGMDGSLGPEMRVTQSPLWDCESSLAEDLDGNLWVAWTRASNELSDASKMRTIHARFFDGKRWLWPEPPIQAPGSESGRLTGYCQAIHPTLAVDSHNRVHLFYRNHSEFMWGHLHHMAYESDAWTEDKRTRESSMKDALNFIWEYSATVKPDGSTLAVYDSLYVKRLGFASEVHQMLSSPAPFWKSGRHAPRGHQGPDHSGPGWAVREKPPRRTTRVGGRELTLYYGDTHSHSWTSDGVDPADMYYNFARDVAKLDYYALSDHDFTISNTPGLEAYLSFLPKAFHTPEFICFQAYEFSSQKTGHRVVLFEGDDNPTFPLTYPPKHRSNTNAELYPFLKKFAISPDSRVLVTAHNMYELGNNFLDYDQGLEPLYDVTSLHVPAEKPMAAYAEKDEVGTGGIWVTVGNILELGMSKKEKRNWHMCWKECLAAGLPLGAFGTSDAHNANGIGYVISGVWAENKSRASIFDALFKRRTMAIDSDIRNADLANVSPPWQHDHKKPHMHRPFVRFYLDESFMGSEVDKPGRTMRAVAGCDHPDDEVRAIVFVKDGVEVHTAFPQGGAGEAEWKDESATPGKHYYYVRVEYKKGRLAFSSPVFVGY